ncbi:MAG TPA: hypothetical protein VGT03_09850 [Candidatus Acidoferrales bacterium]|nr:hypothetical protein [Candidatus Acidoferrales bacterium]
MFSELPLASAKGPAEAALQLVQLSNLAVDIRKLSAELVTNWRARPVAAPAQRKEFTDLRKRKSKRLCPAEKSEDGYIFWGVDAEAALGARWLGENPASFVETNRVHGHACSFCDSPNVHHASPP